MNIKFTALNILLTFALMLMSASASSSMADITVSVTVTASNCKINENQSVKAEFGSIQINKLTDARADVPVTISCDEEPAGTVSMAIIGTGTSFNSQALQTDVSGLGITLTSPSSTLLNLNTYYDINSIGMTGKTGTFNLKARLVSDANTELKGGEFNATATLVIQVS